MFGIGLTKASLGLGSSVILLSMSQLPRIPFQMQTLEQQTTSILDPDLCESTLEFQIEDTARKKLTRLKKSIKMILS